MPSDVSDEALRELILEWYDSPDCAFTLAKRIRDLTKEACAEINERRANELPPAKEFAPDRFALRSAALEMRGQLFPGAAAAEGEARDGEG